MDQDKIQAAVFEAIDEVNEILPPEQQLNKSTDTVLFGQEGALDSLGLVKMIVATEGKIQEYFDMPVTLANERAMSMKNNPFRSVASLIEYTTELLKEEINA